MDSNKCCCLNWAETPKTRSTIIPVCSYIIQPSEGCFDEALASLSTLPNCEATPSEQRNVIVLVTDTDSNESEKSLRNQLKTLPNIDHYSLTFGEIDPDEKGVS